MTRNGLLLAAFVIAFGILVVVGAVVLPLGIVLLLAGVAVHLQTSGARRDCRTVYLALLACLVFWAFVGSGWFDDSADRRLEHTGHTAPA